MRTSGECCPDALVRRTHLGTPCAVRTIANNSMGESIPEFETALRLLYREAWPNATAAQRDLAFKRLPPGDDTIPPPPCTWLRFRWYGAEGTKKSLRILVPQSDNTESVGMEYFQPLLDGCQDVLRECFPSPDDNSTSRRDWPTRIRQLS